MCYYNAVSVTKTEVLRLNDLEKDLSMYKDKLWRPMQSAFEFSDWPVVKPVLTDRVVAGINLEFAHWELIPFWIKDDQALAESRKKFSTLNATAEKLLESKMFREAALNRRCLVLSSGFFEWRHYKPEGSKKDIAYPYYIHLPDREYFFMAGIYQPWIDKATGEMMDTFAIITCPSNELMTQVHNKKKRMPTILPEDLAFEWISAGLTEERIKEIAAHQHAVGEMTAYTIRKDFREAGDPTEPFVYPDLPKIHMP